jgi:hypothetical protein
VERLQLEDLVSLEAHLRRLLVNKHTQPLALIHGLRLLVLPQCLLL